MAVSSIPWRFRRTGEHEPDLPLEEAAASVFEGGGSAAEGTSNEAQVDVLYRQIGQLKVENDFLARKLGK